MKNIGGSRQNSILGFKRRAIFIYLLYLFTNFNYKILLLFLLVIQTVPRDTNSRYFYFYFFFKINKKNLVFVLDLLGFLASSFGGLTYVIFIMGYSLDSLK